MDRSFPAQIPAFSQALGKTKTASAGTHFATDTSRRVESMKASWGGRPQTDKTCESWEARSRSASARTRHTNKTGEAGDHCPRREMGRQTRQTNLENRSPENLTCSSMEKSVKN